MQITPQLLYLVEILDAATLTGNGPQAVQIELPQGAHWSAFCTYELASMLMALDCIAAMPFNLFRHLWSNRLQQTSERFRKEIFDPEHVEHPSDFYDAPGDLRRGISSRGSFKEVYISRVRLCAENTIQYFCSFKWLQTVGVKFNTVTSCIILAYFGGLINATLQTLHSYTSTREVQGYTSASFSKFPGGH